MIRGISWRFADIYPRDILSTKIPNIHRSAGTALNTKRFLLWQHEIIFDNDSDHTLERERVLSDLGILSDPYDFRVASLADSVTLTASDITCYRVHCHQDIDFPGSRALHYCNLHQPSRVMSEFEGEGRPSDSDTVYILVIGLTGSGKSTFINLASGSNLRVSASLDSCTRTVQAAPEFDFEGRQICLVDTPGFDDTERSEVEILRLIRDFLEAQYKANILLHGIIYLQRISDTRMGDVSTRTVRMFGKLCGSGSLKNVTIVTNMWSKEVTAAEEFRERQLEEDERFFKPFLDDHATMVRHDNTLESAHNIMRQICTNRPSVLDIQRESVEQSKTLPSTSAGITLHSALLEPIQGLEAFVVDMQERLKTAIAEGDRAQALQLWMALGKIVSDLARLYNELKNLQALTGEEVDVISRWKNMGSKTQIIAIFRRSFGAENNPEINAFWAALGDTVTIFKEILPFFDECPLARSVRDQLLLGTGTMTPEAGEKFDKWFSDNHKEIRAIRTEVDRLVASKAGIAIEKDDTDKEKKTRDVKKEKMLVRMRSKITKKVGIKRSSENRVNSSQRLVSGHKS